MTISNRNEKHLDLVCDFPARETFRESLFNTLMNIAVDENSIAQPSKRNPRIVRLDEDDLNMLAAAEGDIKPPE